MGDQIDWNTQETPINSCDLTVPAPDFKIPTSRKDYDCRSHHLSDQC